jgi:peptide/nickel transport system permease protein
MRSARLAVLAPIVLAVCYGFSAFAGFLAPYSYQTQQREFSLSPPMRLHMFDPAGHFHLRPFVYRLDAIPDGSATNAEGRSVGFPLRFLVRREEYSLFGVLTSRVHLFGIDEPGRIFLLGTDLFGRDVFSRLLYGSQISLIASLSAALISVSFGMVLGLVSGYYGRWADAVIMRLSDVFLAMPWLYLLLAVRASMPLHLDTRESYLFLAVLMGMIGWARPARLARSVVLSSKTAEYVTAARGFGASDSYLLWTHILPSLRGVLLTQLSLYIPQYILAEVTLSFLGLGVSEPQASWGNMLGDLQTFVSSPQWWLFAPALSLFAVLLAYHGLFAYINRKNL